MRKRLAVHVKKAVRGCLYSYQRAYLFDSRLKKEKEEKSPSEPSHAVCFAIEYGNMLMRRLFLCPRCPLLQPIGGPGTEAYLWGEGGGREAGGEGRWRATLFFFQKPHKSLDTDLRVMCDWSCPPPLLSRHLPLLFSLSPCRHTVHRSFFIFLPPSTPHSPSCPATVFVRPVSLNWYQWRGDGCCVSQLGEMR